MSLLLSVISDRLDAIALSEQGLTAILVNVGDRVLRLETADYGAVLDRLPDILGKVGAVLPIEDWQFQVDNDPLMRVGMMAALSAQDGAVDCQAKIDRYSQSAGFVSALLSECTMRCSVFKVSATGVYLVAEIEQGYPQRDLIGKTIAEVIGAEAQDLILSACQAGQGEVVYPGVVDDELRWFEARIQPCGEAFTLFVKRIHR